MQLYDTSAAQHEMITKLAIYAIEQLGGSLTIAGFEFEQRMRTDTKKLIYEHINDPYMVIFRVEED